jgi:hypothetical protein
MFFSLRSTACRRLEMTRYAIWYLPYAVPYFSAVGAAGQAAGVERFRTASNDARRLRLFSRCYPSIFSRVRA